MKAIYKHIPIVVLCMCILGGCGKAAATADLPEDLGRGYEEFLFFYGMGAEEVQNVLGEELTFVEESYDSSIYKDTEGTEYRFLTEADALYGICYQGLDAETALQLAQSCYDEMYKQHGEDTTFPITNHIYDLESVEDLENNLNIQQYNEMWRVPYNERMEEKIKDFKDTDKVTLTLDLLTPLYMDQGTYAVQLAQLSADTNLTGNAGL